ncbi:Perakine reductase [Melia azedarach]|uniref:Perakine reductase n=1 Tax=Melia azedarach TaxID=155640 RepID=A0ACC1XV68_MELAZ|nr:Perakine reductase [Melia azedarach]
MAEDKKIHVPRVKLGSQGLEVSKIGLGCLELSGPFNPKTSEEDGISLIKHAFNKGITFFDTADVYGTEQVIAKALKQLPREKIQVATKGGIAGFGPNGMIANGTPEWVRSHCEASLKNLDVEYIDLYYQHRIDTTIPIEDTIGELKKLVEEGKIRYIGMSEANPDTIRRAHAVHPITAVQMEWSLWSRDIEEEIVPLCRELGIGIVSSLISHPRFVGENLEKNKSIYTRVEKLAKKHKCTPAQLALAWLFKQGDDVVPIPGTTKIKNLDSNIGSLAVKLTKEDVEEITNAVPIEEVAGPREYNAVRNTSWKFITNTPPKSIKA